MKIVVDSSVILKWLYREDENHINQADLLLKNAVEKSVTLLAPELAKYEVGNVLLMAKKLSKENGVEVLDIFYSLLICFVPESKEIANETYIIGTQSGNTYYDASFAALAKQENAILITDNPKHQAKIGGVKVLPLEQYT